MASTRKGNQWYFGMKAHSAYTGQKAHIKGKAPEAKDFTHQRDRRHHPLTKKARRTNRTKSKIRTKVEHLFAVMKNQFGYRKMRDKGLSKNTQAVFTQYALINLLVARQYLLVI